MLDQDPKLIYPTQTRQNRIQRLGQTRHHRRAKMVFSTVPSNSNWQWTVELLAGLRGVPLSTVRWSCKEQLKIGLCWSVVWRLKFSGVGRIFSAGLMQRGSDKYNRECANPSNRVVQFLVHLLSPGQHLLEELDQGVLVHQIIVLAIDFTLSWP